MVDCQTDFDSDQHYSYPQPHEQKIFCKKMRQLGRYFLTLCYYQKKFEFNPFHEYYSDWDFFLFNLISVFDRYVVSRSCYWQTLNRPKDECLHNNTEAYIKMEFCESCDTDGCNNATQYGPLTLLIAVSVAFAKLLLL